MKATLVKGRKALSKERQAGLFRVVLIEQRSIKKNDLLQAEGKQFIRGALAVGRAEGFGKAVCLDNGAAGF